jgi:hypothetical protein
MFYDGSSKKKVSKPKILGQFSIMDGVQRSFVDLPLTHLEFLNHSKWVKNEEDIKFENMGV